MRFFARLRSVTVIVIVEGKASASKGLVPRAVLEDLTVLCGDEGIGKAEIWIGGDGRRTFSGEIPPHLHQRLRNVLGPG